jgi:FAD/FMN-containing dehydrogenase
MVHGSLGTLGILTKITFRLVPAKQFVRLSYVRRDTIESYHDELLARSTAGDHDFVDGIVHAPDHFVICLGDFVDRAPYVSDYTRTEIFWKSTAVRDEDYLPTWDYCFRYDAECHWMSKTVPPLEWKPVRFLLGRYFLGSTNMISTMKRLDWFFGMKKRQDVVCDVFIPNRRFADFLRWYQRAFDFWPLWIVPYRMPKPYPWLSDAHQERFNDEMHFDLAVYGMPNNRPDLDLSAELERAVFEHDGIKTLIGRNHYDDSRFWDVYSRERYYGIKDRTDPGRVLPDLKERFARVE